jgi:hypothetical protein
MVFKEKTPIDNIKGRIVGGEEEKEEVEEGKEGKKVL